MKRADFIFLAGLAALYVWWLLKQQPSAPGYKQSAQVPKPQDSTASTSGAPPPGAFNAHTGTFNSALPENERIVGGWLQRFQPAWWLKGVDRKNNGTWINVQYVG
jgi:hypothetical protein